MLIPSPFWYASLKILWLFFPLGFPAFLGFSHLQPSSWTKSQPRFAPRKVAALGVGIPKPYSHHWEDIALVPATCRSLWIHVEPTEAKVPQGWSPTFNHHSQVKCWLSLWLIPRFYRFKWKTLPTNQIILWLRLQKSKPSHTFFACNIHCCLPYLELILDHLVTCVFFRLYLKKQIWTHQVQWKQISCCVRGFQWEKVASLSCFEELDSFFPGLRAQVSLHSSLSTQFGKANVEAVLIFCRDPDICAFSKRPSKCGILERWMTRMLIAIPTIQLLGSHFFFDIAISSIAPGSKSTMDHQWLPFQN